MTRYSGAVQSLVWGTYRGGGTSFEVRSPLDGSTITVGEQLEDFSLLEGRDLPARLDFESVGQHLTEGIRLRQDSFVEATRLETGFLRRDCDELIEGALSYTTAFANHLSTQLSTSIEGFTSNGRRMELVELPYGTVAVVLPNNAFLPLALACLLSALRAGNRVILRAPTQSARSASLLADVIQGIPEVASFVSIVICAAPAFVDWFMALPGAGLLHFFGSSRRAAELVLRGFDAGKSVLIDGEGNTWMYVDRTFDPDRAADLLVAGAFRYNGQTCTSINGAIVHPDLLGAVSTRVAAKAKGLTDEVGPVFNERQAEWCLERISRSGGEIAAGGQRKGAFVSPTVVLTPDSESELVKEGIFGPALWLAEGDENDFASRWPKNVYPLCAAVLQSPADPLIWTNRLPNLARLILNGDPSIEDPFEYWGGYPPAGQNPVSPWPSKYRRTVQIDQPT